MFKNINFLPRSNLHTRPCFPVSNSFLFPPLIIVPPFPPKIGQGITDLKFSRSRISSSKERERIRYKKRHLAFPGNGRRLDRAPYSFLSSMNYHNIICRREHPLLLLLLLASGRAIISAAHETECRHRGATCA